MSQNFTSTDQLDPLLLFPAGFGPRGLNKPLGQFASASPRQTGARRIAGVPFVRCAGAGSGQHLVAGPGPNTRERTARPASGTNPSFPCKKHDPRKRFAHHWEDPHFPADFGHTFGHSPEIWSNTEDQVKAEIARTPVGRRKTTQTLVLCVRALVRASARTCGRNPPRGGAGKHPPPSHTKSIGKPWPTAPFRALDSSPDFYTFYTDCYWTPL